MDLRSYWRILCVTVFATFLVSASVQAQGSVYGCYSSAFQSNDYPCYCDELPGEGSVLAADILTGQGLNNGYHTAAPSTRTCYPSGGGSCAISVPIQITDAVNCPVPTPTPTSTPTATPTATPTCTTEVCDGVDNDCDSNIDEGGVCCTEQTEPSCYDTGFGCGSFLEGDFCKPFSCIACYQNGGQHCYQNGYCETPIVIDVLGNGFNLTSAQNGVMFDGGATGVPIRRAWTTAGSDDSWLAFDRNGNGTIDDGSELFGCVTPQPSPPAGEIGNGFIALAEFDKSENGGNGDGKINTQDAAFVNLLLWRDTNHNGTTEPGELTTLPNSVIRAIDLDYKESRRRDRHGNLFKYRARVRDVHGSHAGRWAWDVFPVVEP